MSGKGSSFFEEHIEKIVLAVVGAVCILLLITHVLVSPNKVLYGDEKLSPRELDDQISRQAEQLADKLNGPPEPKAVYEPCFPSFAALLELPIDIDISTYPLVPACISPKSDNRKYRVPMIAKVSDVSVEHIRAAVYVPIAGVDEQNVYDATKSEPNDIDFVTVGAKFDVAGLVESFHECFFGYDVPEDWRDPCLARPVFGAVELQRQELLADGSWSDWGNVPRTRVDPRKEMFEVIEEAETLPPGGIKVRLLQFDDVQVRMDLLQPEAYRIASAEEEWFPPSLHKEYVDYQKEIEAQERLEAIMAEKKDRERRREGTLRGREGVSYEEEAGRGREPWGAGRGGREYGRGLPPRRRDLEVPKRDKPLPKSKRASTTKSMGDFYEALKKLLITKDTDISKMDEPLAFWAHDDTVEPGKSYRYRIRLGVFNPVAGTSQVSEQDESLKSKVVLWSEFAEAAETVEIPERLYFFPLDIREAAKSVTVQVFKYVLGYWRKGDFTVKQGEVIGKVVKWEADEDGTAGAKASITAPETIDYDTGMVLVDVMRVNDWLGGGGRSPRARVYSDMLYSFDGSSIERMPIKLGYWPRELQTKFREVEKSAEREQKPLRPFGSKTVRGTRYAPRVTVDRGDDSGEKRSEEDEEAEAFREMMKYMGGGK